MKSLENTLHVTDLSASAVVIHYEEALYQVYAPLPFTLLCTPRIMHYEYVKNHALGKCCV